MKKALSMAAVLGVSGVCAGDVITFSPSGTSGDWNVAANWNPQKVPGADDRAVIPADKTCDVTADATVDTIEIEAGGTLNVQARVTPGQNKTFEYVGFETDVYYGNCPSPGSGNGTIDCDNPYVVSSDVAAVTCT